MEDHGLPALGPVRMWSIFPHIRHHPAGEAKQLPQWIGQKQCVVCSGEIVGYDIVMAVGPLGDQSGL